MGGSIGAQTPFGRPKKKSSSGRKRNLHSILGQITDRDMELLLQLYEHKILTTHQVHELHFSSEHRARKRLQQLYERAVLDRFRPPQHPGSQPHHYYLDDLGAKLVAGYLGVELKELRFRKDRIFRLSRSQRLVHLRETNGFFTRLVYACRRLDRGFRLTHWYGERRAKRFLVRPDGLGCLRGTDRLIAFWFELDRGSEAHDRLEGKMQGYGQPRLKPETLPHSVLFCFPSDLREARAREALRDLPEITVATTTLERHRRNPLGPVWLPMRAERRVSLLGLPVPGRTELELGGEYGLVPGQDDPPERWESTW
jgi:Replication-relaxation